jgi:hypothetical protein
MYLRSLFKNWQFMSQIPNEDTAPIVEARLARLQDWGYTIDVLHMELFGNGGAFSEWG